MDVKLVSDGRVFEPDGSDDYEPGDVMNAGSGLAPPGLPEIQSPITDDAIGEAVAQAKSTRLYEDAAHEVLRRHVSGHYEIRVERAETSAGGES